MKKENKMLTIQELRYAYSTGSEQMQFDLSVDSGEICAILGFSGSGKSTLLSLLAGFLRPISGVARCEGEDFLATEPHLRPLSILLQDNNLFPQLTVAENIGLGLDAALKLSAQQQAQIEEVAHKLGVAPFLERYPDELSGGQQQRVAIARVLMRQRPILLLDEPFSALDPKLREEMLLLLSSLTKERKMCVLMVTHSPEDAKRVADSFVLIKDGKSVLQDRISNLSNTQNKVIADYLS